MAFLAADGLQMYMQLADRDRACIKTVITNILACYDSPVWKGSTMKKSLFGTANDRQVPTIGDSCINYDDPRSSPTSLSSINFSPVQSISPQNPAASGSPAETMSTNGPHPRSSTETDRTLIATDADEEQGQQQQQRHPTPSSRSRSRAASPARTLVENSSSTTITVTTTPTPYRGFPSRAEYLAALHEWAEEKRFLQPSTTTLTGYYGKETLESYANRPKHEFGISRRLRERKEKKLGRKQSVV
ncbi:hypothetical protein CERZMDRAFT_118955 [Cercospora zeae-maydis SCOH1-5]|uniref:Uncharacterized protein n=1 Tax=Cercospora zeae-maydis SCOH1-5 TaxID=717836 RepID=A0A6A6F648_9PEZI|nr:hypothetical protein CERZMDRAFT_118955 [Cercospora zeae-maydis SCOH1-5]